MPICYLVMSFGSQEPGENIYFLLTGSWVRLYPPQKLQLLQNSERNKTNWKKKIHLNWTKESEDKRHYLSRRVLFLKHNAVRCMKD